MRKPPAPTVSEGRYIGAWQTLLCTLIVDSGRLPKGTAGRKLTSMYWHRKFEKEEEEEEEEKPHRAEKAQNNMLRISRARLAGQTTCDR